MNEKIKILKRILGDLRLKENYDLTLDLATKLGGEAKAFFIATNESEFVQAVKLCRQLHLEFLIIGSGSKIAIGKDGFAGLAVKNRVDTIKIAGIKGVASKVGIGIESVMIEAQSGVTLKKLAEFVMFHKLTGLEVLKNSIGTIGGSLLLNEILRSKTQKVKVLTQGDEIIRKDLNTLLKGDIILSVIFKLKRKDYA